MLKSLIKIVIPNRVLMRVNMLKRRMNENANLKRAIKYEFKRMKNIFSQDIDPSSRSLKKILLCYHVLEKGLAMPNRRYGFGKEIMLQLMSTIDDHIRKFGNNNEQIDIAIGVVAEYMHIHQDFPLDIQYKEKIQLFLNKHSCVRVEQVSMTKEKYFKYSDSSFDLFSTSRHSLRSFEGEVSMHLLYESIKIAQNAPSACNRQSTRVKIIKDKTIIKQILEIQTGNRGFGYLMDKLLILTSDMNYWDIVTKNGGYIDGGIYAMNLLYALHFNHIGACPLNACFSSDDENKIRKIADIPYCETIILFIAIGGAPNKFMLTNAHRTNYMDIIREL